MNRTISTIAAVTILAAGAGSWTVLNAQQGTPSQPGTPSKPAKPSNPTPRPSNPLPGPQNPTPSPNPDPNPNQPVQPNNPNNPNNPNQPADPNGVPQPPTAPDARARAARNSRPFAFQSPEMEGRFNEGSRRLMSMERRMKTSQENLLKRLGEVRQLTPERQSAATFDLIQQMLKDNADMQQYLVQSRSLWTGDLDDATEGEVERPAELIPPTREEKPIRNR